MNAFLNLDFEFLYFLGKRRIHLLILRKIFLVQVQVWSTRDNAHGSEEVWVLSVQQTVYAGRQSQKTHEKCLLSSQTFMKMKYIFCLKINHVFYSYFYSFLYFRLERFRVNFAACILNSSQSTKFILQLTLGRKSLSVITAENALRRTAA